MRKSLLLTLALLLSTAMFAQSRAVLLNESFDTTTVPSGWEVYNGGGPNWSIQDSNKAGGTPCELEFFWDPNFIGISYLSMGIFDFSNIENITVSFKFYYEHYSNSASIGVATSSDGGVTWNTAWTQEYNTTGKYVIDEVVTSPDMGKTGVKFALFFNGDSNDINYCCFDDIMLFAQEANDINLLNIDVSDDLGVGESEVKFTVKNIGIETVETIEAKYQIEGQEAVTENFEISIASFEEKQMTFSVPISLFPGEYKLSVEVSSVNGTNDGDPTNNFLDKDLTVGFGIAQRYPMIEHFSSATCYPCTFTNQDMLELTAANPGEYTYTKYPMNGPGTGDPYYTNECGTRRSYYSVQGVPMIFLDGTNVELPLTQEKFDERYNTPSFVNIRGAFNVEGNTVNVTADFMSYVDINNARAYISINEKTTTENTVDVSDGGNGETEFHHIMMKMLESAQGNTISIKAGEYQRLEYSYDMSSTNVEEMSDLEVSLWLQNYSTKKVYNSHFAYENAEHAYPVQNLNATAGACAIEFSVSWDAPQQGNPTAYNIYVNGELIEENYQELSYTNYDELADELAFNNQENIVEVVAVYENGMTSVGVAKIIERYTSIEEVENEIKCNIYPNPAKDFVKLSAVSCQLSAVRIYNCLGMLVEEIEMNSNEVEINTSNYNTGIYFISIETENGNVTKKLVVE